MSSLLSLSVLCFEPPTPQALEREVRRKLGDLLAQHCKVRTVEVSAEVTHNIKGSREHHSTQTIERMLRRFLVEHLVDILRVKVVTPLLVVYLHRLRFACHLHDFLSILVDAHSLCCVCHLHGFPVVLAGAEPEHAVIQIQLFNSVLEQFTIAGFALFANEFLEARGRSPAELIRHVLRRNDQYTGVLEELVFVRGVLDIRVDGGVLSGVCVLEERFKSVGVVFSQRDYATTGSPLVLLLVIDSADDMTGTLTNIE